MCWKMKSWSFCSCIDHNLFMYDVTGMSLLAFMMKVSVSLSRALLYDWYSVLSSKGFLDLNYAKASGISTCIIHIWSLEALECMEISLTLCLCCHHEILNHLPLFMSGLCLGHCSKRQLHFTVMECIHIFSVSSCHCLF
jgi:hypothetical protein